MNPSRAVALAVAATIVVAAGFLLGFPIGPAVVHGYVVVMAALGVAAFARAVALALPPAPPSRFDRAHRRRPGPPPARPQALTQLEELLAGGLSAGAVHFRLRPLLREIAASRLRMASGIDLDTHVEASRARLGAELWDLVAPEREAPANRLSPGLTLPALRRVVEGLERLR